MARTLAIVSVISFFLYSCTSQNQPASPTFHYIVSFPDPAAHTYHVELQTRGWKMDTVCFKLPNWMPGYYQIMNYADGIDNVTATDANGNTLEINEKNNSTWMVTGTTDKYFTLSYDVKTERKFVANSYVDEDHAYLITGNSFFYVDGFLDLPVSIQINNYAEWDDITTGLNKMENQGEYSATDFDILYDCPILAGDLEKLPSFEIDGITHDFIGYKMGEFDHGLFMSNLKKVVQAAVDIFDDIPYDHYTFIGIGPGFGGIEHLNNTTVSFDGSRLQSDRAMNGTMSFLGHEYFHHYNVKRIRPYELGPFDYENGSRTNLLWISEGLSVYYQNCIIYRAGLINKEELIREFEGEINHLENNPGRHLQSLAQSSYYTWEDGPFGRPGKTISYYNKGPIIGLLLEFAIRDATNNEKCLDDVMRYLYSTFYQEKQRGFTDAELQSAFEMIADSSLSDLFEYIYSTKELDYNKYLNMAGLELVRKSNPGAEKQILEIKEMENMEPEQEEILRGWLGI